MNNNNEEIKNTEETENMETVNTTEENAEQPAAEEIQASEDSAKKNEEKYTAKKFLNDVFDVLETVCVFLLIFFLLKAYVFDQAVVDGESMVPNLQPEQRLIYSKIYSPHNEDIVIADNERLGLIVKRVIAVEGQEIDIRDGEVYVDGEKLSEQVYSEGAVLNADYFVNTPTEIRSYNVALQYPAVVPEGCVFLMGDNRGISEDSRGSIVGFVRKEDIVGKVVLRYSPFSEFKIF